MKNILKQMWKYWLQLCQLINKVITCILLSLLFLLLVTPQACIKRYAHKRTKKDGLFYRRHEYTFNDLLKPW